MAQSNVRREVRGVIFFAVAIFLFLCLFSYDRLDPSFNVSSDRSHVLNYAGPVGAYTADLLFLFFGLTAYLLPAALLILAFSDFTHRQVEAVYTKLIGGVFLFISASGFLALYIHHWQLKAHMLDGSVREFPMEAGG